MTDSDERFDISNVSTRLNSLRVAHHEAGHAVATIALGFALERVWIAGNEGYSERKRDHDADIVARHGQAEMSRRLAVIALAGEHAQCRWQSECLDFGCDQDRGRARLCAERYAALLGVRFDHAIAQLNRDCSELVRANWQTIEAVALSLHRLQDMTGDQVSAIFASEGGQHFANRGDR
jgi:hypothetical protein